MLLAELGGEEVRAAGGESGKLRQRTRQPVDRDSGDAAAKGGLVHGVLDLFRNFLSRNQEPGFKIGVAFASLIDFTADAALVESGVRPVAPGLEYKVSSTYA